MRGGFRVRLCTVCFVCFFLKITKHTVIFFQFECFFWNYDCMISKAQWSKKNDTRENIAAKFACHETHSAAKVMVCACGLAVSSACRRGVWWSAQSISKLDLRCGRAWPEKNICANNFVALWTFFIYLKTPKKRWTFFLAGQPWGDQDPSHLSIVRAQHEVNRIPPPPQDQGWSE